MKTTVFSARLPLAKTLLLLSLFGGLSLVTPLQAQQSQDDAEYSEEQVVVLNQAELDQILAPIALYPDTLLSHILVASTYPLEVIQAARWRNKHAELEANEALQQAEAKDWDPSVIALVPFKDLLNNLSEDLQWLQSLGDAFLANEEQVLASVQNLRKKAYEQGTLTNNEYIEVEREDNNIVIQTVKREVVYVPYYDTRVVYGDWWWSAYQPYYWHHPRHYHWDHGFYWSPHYYVSTGFYFGGFAWHQQHVVVNYHHRHRSVHDHHRKVLRTKEYSRWQHNPKHRRSVKYDYVQPHHRQVRTIEKSKLNGQVKVLENKSRFQTAHAQQVQKLEKRIISDKNRDQRQVDRLQHKLKQSSRNEQIDKRIDYQHNAKKLEQAQERNLNRHASRELDKANMNTQREVKRQVNQQQVTATASPAPRVEDKPLTYVKPTREQQLEMHRQVKERAPVVVQPQPQRYEEKRQFTQSAPVVRDQPKVERRQEVKHSRQPTKQRSNRDERKYTR